MNVVSKLKFGNTFARINAITKTQLTLVLYKLFEVCMIASNNHLNNQRDISLVIFNNLNNVEKHLEGSIYHANLE